MSELQALLITQQKLIEKWKPMIDYLWQTVPKVEFDPVESCLMITSPYDLEVKRRQRFYAHNLNRYSLEGGFVFAKQGVERERSNHPSIHYFVTCTLHTKAKASFVCRYAYASPSGGYLTSEMYPKYTFVFPSHFKEHIDAQFLAAAKAWGLSLNK